MRLNCSDEDTFSGQFALWQANTERSLRGKRGHESLVLLREALLALPKKELIAGTLFDEQGGVCAIGAYGRHVGVDLLKFCPEDTNHDEVGIQGGMPKLVAWHVVAQNDGDFECMTNAGRYEATLAWVEKMLTVKPL